MRGAIDDQGNPECMRVWEWLVPDRSTSDLVPGQVFSLLSLAAGTVETNLSSQGFRSHQSRRNGKLSSPKALNIGQQDQNVFVLKVVDQTFKHFISEEIRRQTSISFHSR